MHWKHRGSLNTEWPWELQNSRSAWNIISYCVLICVLIQQHRIPYLSLFTNRRVSDTIYILYQLQYPNKDWLLMIYLERVMLNFRKEVKSFQDPLKKMLCNCAIFWDLNKLNLTDPNSPFGVLLYSFRPKYDFCKNHIVYEMSVSVEK